MSLQLQPDQLLTVLERLGSPGFPGFKAALLDLTADMAAAVCEAVPGLEHSAPTFWDGMVCAPVRPTADVPMPAALAGLDDGGWEDVSAES